MYSGDEIYDDEITSGPTEAPAARAPHRVAYRNGTAPFDVPCTGAACPLCHQPAKPAEVWCSDCDQPATVAGVGGPWCPEHAPMA